MHIAFDNPVRLIRNVYFFEYEQVRFKLIQQSKCKWADTLLTIVESIDSDAAHRAFTAAGKFASAFGWVNRIGVPIHHTGGFGIPASFRLRQAQSRISVFSTIPHRDRESKRGYSLSPIAKISSESQRIGLILFREAKSSNKAMLSLLLYWQILEILHDPVVWTNKILRSRPPELRGIGEYLRRLPLEGRRPGDYLLEDCRHAIAHIQRKAGRRALRFDDNQENARIAISARVTEQLAEYYIRTELTVAASLYRVRPRSGGFPVYLDGATIKRGRYSTIRERSQPKKYGETKTLL